MNGNEVGSGFSSVWSEINISLATAKHISDAICSVLNITYSQSATNYELKYTQTTDNCLPVHKTLH